MWPFGSSRTGSYRLVGRLPASPPSAPFSDVGLILKVAMVGVVTWWESGISPHCKAGLCFRENRLLNVIFALIQACGLMRTQRLYLCID